MNLKSASKSRVGILMEINPTLPDAIILALHLLEQSVQKEKSFFHPFIQYLPSLNEMESTIFYTKVRKKNLLFSYYFISF